MKTVYNITTGRAYVTSELTKQNFGVKRLAAIAHEMDNIKAKNDFEAGLTYGDKVRRALSVLSYGGHYSHAVPVGVQAVLWNDQRTLRRLVKAAHDDTGLIEALQTATGKKLAYLAHEF